MSLTDRDHVRFDVGRLRGTEINALQREWVQQRAADLGISVSELVRQMIDRFMAETPSTRDPRLNERVAEYVKSGGRNGRRGNTGKNSDAWPDWFPL